MTVVSVLLVACSAGLLGAEPSEDAAPIVIPQSTPPVEVFTTARQPGEDELDLTEGTPEHAIRSSLQMLRDGQVDAWVATWCHTDTCTSASVIETMKAFGIKRASGAAAGCLKGDDDRVFVTSRSGDEDVGPLKLFVECEGRRPVPSTHVLVDGRWMVKSFSW